MKAFRACLKTRAFVAAEVTRRMVSAIFIVPIRLLTSAATLFKQALREKAQWVRANASNCSQSSGIGRKSWVAQRLRPVVSGVAPETTRDAQQLPIYTNTGGLHPMTKFGATPNLTGATPVPPGAQHFNAPGVVSRHDLHASTLPVGCGRFAKMVPLWFTDVI
jgi:hypothetical protein